MEKMSLGGDGPDINIKSQPPSAGGHISSRALQPHSCVICQRRKVKCERADPCSNCVKHKVQCEYRSPAPPRRRKRTSPDPDVYTKLKRYEDILQGYGVKPEDLNGDQGPPRPNQLDSPLPLASAKSEASTASKKGNKTPQSPLASIQRTKWQQSRYNPLHRTCSVTRIG